MGDGMGVRSPHRAGLGTTVEHKVDSGAPAAPARTEVTQPAPPRTALDQFASAVSEKVHAVLGGPAAPAATGKPDAPKLSMLDFLFHIKGDNAAGSVAAPQDLAAYTQQLQHTLCGVLNLTHVSAATAGREMARLSKLNDRDLERVADGIGASALQRLLDSLAPADRRKYASTEAKLQKVHFGALLDDAARHGVAPKDTSAAFQSTLDSVQAHTNKLPADAKDYVYLQVPGLITEHYPGYMDENVKRLQDRGLTVHRSRIDTDLGVEKNAETLRNEINDLAQKTGKKVVLLAHSKGGPDAALALRDRRTQDNVHLFVAIQPAYGGTPVADTVNNSFLDAPTRFVLNKVWKAADGKAVEDLSFRAQKERFSLDRGNPPLEVPTLSLATAAADLATSGSALSPLASYMESCHYGSKARSDGMVPLTSQQIPGRNAAFVQVDGMSHEETIGQGKHPKYSPGDLTEALITLGLQQAAHAQRT